MDFFQKCLKRSNIKTLKIIGFCAEGIHHTRQILQYDEVLGKFWYILKVQ